MRNSITIAAVAAAVAALLIGGWFLFSRQDTKAAPASPGSGPAPTTELPRPSSSTSAYPFIPDEQVRPESKEDYGPMGLRTGRDGRQLLFPLTESECMTEEFRLLGEHPDRVDVEIRMIAKPPPPTVSLAPDGSYGCMGVSSGYGQGPYASIELRTPLGARPVIIHREA